MGISTRLRRRGLALAWGLPAAALAAGTVTWLLAQEKQPYYVGARVCGSCHQGRSTGDQHSLWLMSKHARSYAVLAKPEAKEIVRLSGITQEPQQSPICLGCHATAAEAEQWEKDPTFFVGDGIQCEKCHGPGSEYMDDKVMRDHKAAVAAGLKLPTRRDCMACHNTKGSHVAVHHLPQFNIEEAWKAIDHPTPEKAVYEIPTESSQPAAEGPKFVGVEACAQCHSGTAMGYQFSKWRMSSHARAFAVLASPAALEIARQAGLEGEPQRSPDCLRCHTTAYNLSPGRSLSSFSPTEGVGCERCHGAGSEYMPQAVMLDRTAARTAGLRPVTRTDCMECHENAHGKPFDIEKAWNEVSHPTRLAPTSEAPPYKTPIRLAFHPDGRQIFVACEGSGTVIIVDSLTGGKVAELPVGGQATGIAFSPDGALAYVSSRLNDNVAVVDVANRSVLRTLKAGDEPHGLLTDSTGKQLYVLNTSEDSISVLDILSGQETKRLPASTAPWSIAPSPDGKRMFITNTRSRPVPFRNPPVSEITVLDTGRGAVIDRYAVTGANYLQGIAWHPSGDFAFFTLLRTKNLVPMTRVIRGWTITNGLGVIWRDGSVDQVLLDEPNLCFPDPTDIAFTPDGRRALVTSSGSDRVAVIDVPKLIALLQSATTEERERVLPNHLGKASEFVITHIPTENSPRGIVIAPDGKTAYVANALDDSLTVIDLERMQRSGRIDLGGPREISQVRWGERLFHSASVTFHRAFSCHSCHPDGHVNGLTFDIEPDGIGSSPVDNRTLRGILDTAPFKWEGTNPSLAHECGPRLAVFFTRIAPFTPEQLSALVSYIAHIPRPPNRYRPVGADLTDAQRRGREIFYRSRNNSGAKIPEENRCSYCHAGSMYTDRQIHDVGTRMRYDRAGRFETPHLNNIYDSAPYLHNGVAPSLEEIWTRFNPYDTHGVTNDLTKDQLNDLIEFLKTL